MSYSKQLVSQKMLMSYTKRLHQLKHGIIYISWYYIYLVVNLLHFNKFFSSSFSFTSNAQVGISVPTT